MSKNIEAIAIVITLIITLILGMISIQFYGEYGWTVFVLIPLVIGFLPPLTKWEEPHLLAFDVKEQPIPMNELNPFWEVHPPHLDGYFKSHRGQFSLTSLTENKTMLEGTTWYQVNITPEIYWEIWSDFIIHRIHTRVLNHIKRESENQ